MNDTPEPQPKEAHEVFIRCSRNPLLQGVEITQVTFRICAKKGGNASLRPLLGVKAFFYLEEVMKMDNDPDDDDDLRNISNKGEYPNEVTADISVRSP